MFNGIYIQIYEYVGRYLLIDTDIIPIEKSVHFYYSFLIYAKAFLFTQHVIMSMEETYNA